MPLLVVPIIQDLKLSFTQISILMGFAFILFYAVLSLPVARLVDRMSRKLILGFGIAIWSGMTGICGLAQNFWQFFLMRMGIGVGEACNGPSMYSLLSDLFPPNKLPRAIAVLNLGYMFGTGIALLVGGTIIGTLYKLPEVTLPVVGLVKPWQMTFLIVGFPGLLIAALVATIKEPKRRGLMTTATGGDTGVQGSKMSVTEVARYLNKHRRAYGPMYLALAIQTIMITGVISWMPTLFIISHGWSIEKYGQVMGVVFLCISPIGLMLGGYLAEWLTGRGYNDANMRVVTMAAVAALPFMVLVPIVHDVLFAIQNFISGLAIGPQNAAFQVITPNQIRGQVTALYILIINVLGFGFGPFFIAFLTDNVFADQNMVGVTMSLVAAVLETLAAFVFWRGMKPYGERYAQTRDLS